MEGQGGLVILIPSISFGSTIGRVWPKLIGLARHESNVAGFGADATLLDQRVTLDTCLSFFTCM